MNLKNNSKKVICIDEKRLVPNQTITIDDSYKNNAVIKAMIQSSELEVVEEQKGKTAERASMADFESFLESNPTYKQLQAFARKNGIETSDAKSVEEITAVIKAVLTV